MNKGFKIVKWTVVCALFVVLVGYITMTLWNWLVPSLFNGPAISFLQALGLLVLSKILFGSFGGKKCGNHGPAQWKHRYYEKLSSMTPEEKERFKSRMQEKWCSNKKNTSA
jgi:hypothetical protein